ncbi:MAG TPA: tetratricopeptide repeat protein, partial [Micropepsaceae bacterium]|nr:tetratricopeptide repeat protein [Micropepsaceae bacterium]
MDLRSKPARATLHSMDEYTQRLRNAAGMEQARRFADARQLYLAAATAKPGDAAALDGAARMAGIIGDHRAAIEYLGNAIAANPERDVLRDRLAGALMNAGELAGAEEQTLTALERRPNDVNLLNLLGVIQKRRGRLADALATFRKGIEIEPANHSPWYNLGNSLLGMGEFGEAVDALKRATELKPKDSETMRLFGQALIGKDELTLGMAAFARALELNPKNCRVYTSRATALQRAGAPDTEVLAELDKAIALEPGNAEHLRAKAAYFQRRSRFAEAEAVHKELLAKDPDDIETLMRLGHLLGYSLRRYEEANQFLRHALELKPDDPRCLSGLCKSLLDSRYGVESDHIEEAGKIAHRLIATGTDLTPHAANLSGVFLRLADYEGLDALGDRSKLMAYWVDRGNVGSLHNQLGRVVTKEDRLELVHWHREWGRRVEEVAAKTPITHKPSRRVHGSKIRIGLMSSDLRDHPVAYFALPIIEHYDRNKFEFFCYSFYPAPPDRVQSFIQQRVGGFRSMLQATDQEIAQQIADDDLDILFELGGSTRYNRLEVMAYRAAPLQASWLGYPHSAGIGTIDYIMVDPYIKPDDPALLIEKPFVMPESWVVLGRLGFRDEPIEPGIPADRNGFFTFGTMNNPYKYTP